MQARAQYQIIAPAADEAPTSYVLTGTQQFEVMQVFAQYDGTGASGNYKPAVEFFSNSNDSLGIMPITSIVTAGASVDCTWFPWRGREFGSSTRDAGSAVPSCRRARSGHRAFTGLRNHHSCAESKQRRRRGRHPGLLDLVHGARYRGHRRHVGAVAEACAFGVVRIP